MGKKGKVGKSRRDKFYHLAKETGYRSRSAFKLIQLNRRFQFLQKSRALLDLCAAPGGWLQVASKFMPVSSLVVGVDLVPIKPLPNVVTLQEDITTERCRQALRKELQTWKVDVVLHDGAPNVGSSWDHDAYSQAHLSLQALRLACDFLARGGWFISKVFRSRDYAPLLWLFQQLFCRVQSTKPQASRNESAEIFVVCQGYLAPDKIDGKFFDPKYAFKEVEVQAKTVTELVTKKKPKAEGYAEGDLTLYHRFSLTDFLRAPNPVDFLSKASEITLDDPELEGHPATTEDVRESCRDIRVLGRKELRSLLNWRTKLRRFVAKKLKEQAKALDISLSSGEEDAEDEERDQKTQLEAERKKEEEEEEEQLLHRSLAEMKAQEVAELKRKKRKLLREQRKQRERVELKMDLPGVSIADGGDSSMFSLSAVRGRRLMQEMVRGDMGAADALLAEAPDADVYLSDADDANDDLSSDGDLDPEERPEARSPRRRAKHPGGKKPEEEEEEEEEEENPLLVSLTDKATLQEQQTSLWFSKGAFVGIEDDADEELELQQSQVLLRASRAPRPDARGSRGRAGGDPREPPEAGPGPGEGGAPDPLDPRAQAGSPGDTEAAAGAGGSESDHDTDDSSSISSEEEEGEAPRQRAQKRGRPEAGDGFEVVPIEDPGRRRVLDAEGLALGAVVATSRRARRDLVDASFSRYAFNEEAEELPPWFAQDEQQHRTRPLPLDRQEVERYRARWRQIDARPIRKVAEAKARKKRRMLKKQEQTRKKAEAVVGAVDVSDGEKAAQLRSLYKKAGLGKEKRQVTYIVAKKGAGGRKVRRPAGVKGHFKVVDTRMKKDLRAQRRQDRRKRRKKK
ncbi:LOW QUALITY PROTEIN: pre-rRNA 2'-O-ribose RNA methyltransferase FTSJ3 [Tachyglossus aculeatus]|uniref:LOW QUALITY PROTEIN: pre-rRNA 2'-O-ribose RNA methyltransferase FTSJ3 n=1 Tax=Tachyglossus aculeatus TaxID=9261 RepID=UPI0018F41E6E|nr:LOW QUALITY PROTEIN: pre-rRNA 2'-O-ribose RNA methyltransferase FTSJ3 [Tachyglossus aculeatus]